MRLSYTRLQYINKHSHVVCVYSYYAYERTDAINSLSNSLIIDTINSMHSLLLVVRIP